MPFRPWTFAGSCTDSSSDEADHGLPSCEVEEYARDHYVECTTEFERQATYDDTREAVERLNVSMQNPGTAERLNCNDACRSDAGECPQVIHACNAVAGNPDDSTCVWRLLYWSDDGYSSRPSPTGGDEMTRMPYAICDCDLDLAEDSPWCEGEVPEDF